MNLKQPIYVTQPFLPPLEEFQPYLEKIWENKWLTNNGPFHQQLEKELCLYLGVKYISLFSNGTLALLTALQALDISGEVITTPYSFIATSHAIWWNKLIPVFIDVDPLNGNLDPKKIEGAITSKTSAIMPVHVYGNPCETIEIQSIAKKHSLKVIYDAAHAFGVKQNGESILNAGDLSVLSFHATKVFNTFEGGAIICHDAAMKQHIDDLKNFGFRDETIIVAPGINAKMNELQSAFGLLQLKYIDEAIQKRKEVAEKYRLMLHGIDGVEMLDINADVTWNYSYFPIFISNKYRVSRDELYLKLKSYNINVRRYFYPLLSEFSPYKELTTTIHGNLLFAREIANQVISLPIYPELQNETIELVCSIIK